MTAGVPSVLLEDAVFAFAREINDATETVARTDAANAPELVLLPTGALTCTVFSAGRFAEVNDVGDVGRHLLGRLVTPNTMLFVHSGWMQEATMRRLESIEESVHLAVVGTPVPFNDLDYTTSVSVHPDRLVLLDKRSYKRVIFETARRTLQRIEAFEAQRTDEATLARDRYGNDVDRYREGAISALNSVGMSGEEHPSEPSDTPR